MKKTVLLNMIVCVAFIYSSCNKSTNFQNSNGYNYNDLSQGECLIDSIKIFNTTMSLKLLYLNKTRIDKINRLYISNGNLFSVERDSVTYQANHLPAKYISNYGNHSWEFYFESSNNNIKRTFAHLDDDNITSLRHLGKYFYTGASDLDSLKNVFLTSSFLARDSTILKYSYLNNNITDITIKSWRSIDQNVHVEYLSVNNKLKSHSNFSQIIHLPNTGLPQFSFDALPLAGLIFNSLDSRLNFNEVFCDLLFRSNELPSKIGNIYIKYEINSYGYPSRIAIKEYTSNFDMDTNEVCRFYYHCN